MNFWSNFCKRVLNQKAYAITLCITLALMVVTAITYAVGYTGSMYYAGEIVVTLWVALPVFIALFFFEQTHKYAPIVLWGFNLVAFMLFVLNTYMYLTEVFYNGQLSAENFANISGIFIACVIMFLLCAVLSNVAMWMVKDSPKSPETKEVTAKEEAE